jgi:chromosome segregation ATPase
MEIEIDQQKYNMLYAQRLETLLHEQIRKTIDLEVRISLSYEMLEEQVRRYDESQKQVDIQNEIMQQAARSIEELTLKTKNYEISVKEFTDRIIEMEKRIDGYSEKNTVLDKTLLEKETKIKTLERELNRQNSELQVTFDDLQKLKEESSNKKPINKNKNPVEDGTF